MKKWLIGLMGLVLLFVIPMAFVSADDDHDRYKYQQERDQDEHEYKKHYREREDDDDEENHDEENGWQVTENTDAWRTWNKTPEALNIMGTTPIDQPTQISITGISNQQIPVEAVPMNGQVLVPLQDVANYLEAKATYYEKITIAEVTKGNQELLFKLNTRVAYENRQKRPAPVGLVDRSGTLYIPVSVIGEGLGYEITWNDKTKQIIFKSNTH